MPGNSTFRSHRLRLATVFGLASLGQMTLALSASAGIVVWDGTCGNTFWSSVCNPGSHTNWMPDVLPSLSDTVSANTLVTLFGDVGNASTVSFPSGLSMTNGSVLNIAGAGGTITNLSITNSSINAQTAGTIVEIDGSSASNGGAVYGDGKVQNIGTLSGLSLAVKNVASHPGTFVNTLGGSATFSSIATEPGVSVENDNATLTLVPHAQFNGGALGVSGHGLFTNSGTFVTQSNGSAISSFTIGCSMLQTAGSFNVQGQSNATGTVLFGGALFSGGDIHVNDNANLRFQTGVSGIYEFDGLSGITGNGNAFVQLGPFVGPDWRVQSDLNVNLTGTTGFKHESGNITLTGALTNQGTAQWSGGTLRGDVNCGGCAPAYRNEGSLTLSAPGGTLDTFLHNKPGGTIVHKGANIGMAVNAVLLNDGIYSHESGNMNETLPNQAFESFVNNNLYLRPNVATTLDAAMNIRFVLNPGSAADFHRATTTFAGPGLYITGGNTNIYAPAVVRAVIGNVQNNSAMVFGDGQFRVGNTGAPATIFSVNDNRRLTCDLGPDLNFARLSRGASDGGVYLDPWGRVGGVGYIRNINQFFWNGGSIGDNGGEGGVENLEDTFITSGAINGLHAWFDNADTGVVEQTGSLSINSGEATNFGTWYLLSSLTLQISGASGIFQNLGGSFIGDCGPLGTVSVNGKFDNEGWVEARSGLLAFSGPVLQVSGNTLTGGSWIVGPLGILDLPGTLTTIGPDADVTCDIDGTFDDLKSITTNQGHLTLDGFPFNNALTNDGWIELGGNEPIQVQGGGGNLNNGTAGGANGILKFLDEYVVPALAGNGGRGGAGIPFALQCANLNNHAIVRPGGPAAPGPFKMDGNFNQSATGMLQVELGGSTPIDGYDQLIVDGNVTLGGILSVRILPGFAPAPGQQFAIISASNGSISGTFDQVQGFGTYRVSYAPNSVTLTVVNPPKPGDANGDGLVNVNDLLAVINYWGLCPLPPTFCIGDLNGDGQVNVNDLLAVINHWGS